MPAHILGIFCKYIRLWKAHIQNKLIISHASTPAKAIWCEENDCSGKGAMDGGRHTGLAV